VGCFLILFALISPRLALFFMWVFGWQLDVAYESFWLGFLGFLFLPWTTLTYALAYEPLNQGVNGLGLALVAFAFIVDVMSFFGARKGRTYYSATTTSTQGPQPPQGGQGQQY
jgi:hypothetical protein